MNRNFLYLGLGMILGCSRQSPPPIESKTKAAPVEQLTDGSQWTNPILKYDGEALILIPGDKKISQEEIVSALNGLPERAWPQGRKVAIEAIYFQDSCHMLAPLRVKLFFEKKVVELQENGFGIATWSRKYPMPTGDPDCK